MSTASTTGWSDTTGPEALSRYAPESATHLDALIATSPDNGPRRLISLARLMCAHTLSLPPLPIWDDVTLETTLDAVEQRASSFAEQFSVDVSMLDETSRAELGTMLGGRTWSFVSAVYVADWAPRVRHALDRLFSPSSHGWPVTTEPGGLVGDSWPLIDQFMRSVAQLRVLDPVTTEMVRLREARQHNCRICKSLRSRSALSAGADESTFDEIDHYETSTLSARHKAALAFVDALVWQPGYMDDAALDAVRQHFSPAEAVELTLDIMRNASSKMAVATGSDEAHVSDGVEIYDVNDDGTLSFGLSTPAG